MSFNLIDLVKDQVGNQVASQASKFLGESESTVQSALSGILPSVLGGVIEKGSDEKGASGLLDMLKGQDTSALGDIAGLFSGSNSKSIMDSGSGMLSSLFGNKLGGLVGMISKFSGLKDGSTSSLMNMATPIIMSILGKKVMGDNLGVSGLMSMLAGQKENVANAMPSGLSSLMSSSGFGGLWGLAKSGMDTITGAGETVVEGVGNVAGAGIDAGKKVVGGAADLAGDAVEAGVDTGKSLLKWLLPVLAVLLLLGLWGARTGCGAIDNAAEAVASTTNKVVDGTADAVGTVANATEEMVKDGANAVGGAISSVFSTVNDAAKATLDAITFAAGSAGDQMMKFIEGGAKGDNLFRFSNLTFATGSDEINGETAIEVDNLAAILKAYPDVKINVSGHTDNTGDADANMALSHNRAKSVKARLISQGVEGDRISTEGYGSDKPVATNDTPEGREQNRRIDVSIVQ